MSPDDNKAVIRAYVETIFNQKQVDRADDLVAPDYVDHAALPGQAPGLEGAKQKLSAYTFTCRLAYSFTCRSA